MRRRGLTETDRAAWAQYARLVAPLRGVVAPALPPEPVAVPAPASSSPQLPSPMMVKREVPSPGQRQGALVVGGTPAGVDASTWNRFRQNKLPTTRTLDLHGRTAQRAYVALELFLLGAAGEGVRCVEVITGRGSGEAGGVIRREFPLWLNQPHLRHLVLGAAHPHALNPGSVRLLLRRARARGSAG